MSATGRVAVVIGASSGIGRATAHLLAARSDRLVLAARSQKTLEQARQECVARGAEDTIVVPTDVSDRAAVDALFEAATSTFGRVDSVVYAASVLAYGRFEDVPADVFDKSVATNIIGTANVARSALLAFESTDTGSLVVVGSVLGKMATPYMSTYVTSKWAMHGLVRVLQIENRPRPDVRISLVSPGGVDTPIYDQAGTYTGHPGSPPPPVDPPEKVARAIVAALDHPQREIGIGFANPFMVAGFRLLPGLFDTIVGPMMRFAGQGNTSVGHHPGNIFEPNPDKEAVHGRWPHIWG